MSDQVSHPYKTRSKIVVLCILIFIFLDSILEDESILLLHAFTPHQIDLSGGDEMGGTGVYIMELRNANQIFVEARQWKRLLEI
jgi:hypothetical protein